jgi:hypothetical protein
MRAQDESALIILVLQGEDLGALSDHGLRSLGICVKDLADLGIVGEAIRVVTGIPEAWELERPVGELEPQRIPALGTPPLADPVALEDDVLAVVMLENPAHCEARLTAADNDGVVV